MVIRRDKESKRYFELAAHGHYHQCVKKDIGECEFFELDSKESYRHSFNVLKVTFNCFKCSNDTLIWL